MGSHDEIAIEKVARSRRDALLAEYSEVAGNFRLLTDIRFKLLAFLPIAAGAATALLSAGKSRDGASEVRALVLSLFGLLVTIGLATYNGRNDQLYDALVGRAASIEWQLGLFDGAFANRPTSWLSVGPPRIRWRIHHRSAVTLIYCASVGLWVFSVCAAGLQLRWGRQSAPRALLAAAILPAIIVPALGLWSIRSQRKRREDKMCQDAADATQLAVDADLANPDELRKFLTICSRLGDVSLKDAEAREKFYRRLPADERRQFIPSKPDHLVAAHFVALISDLPAEWIHDCYKKRRKDPSPAVTTKLTTISPAAKAG